jgi:transposase InsO family protein
MEETWIADRSTLRHLLTLHPNWTHPQFADCLHRSLSWVKKWRKRFSQADPTDLAVVFGLSRARHTPIPPMDERIERAILDIRDEPPEDLGRVPGPKAILYYLPRRAEFVDQNVRLPRSTRTIWKVLRRHDRILQAPQRKKRPIERRDPLEEIQIDFKDASTVAPDPSGEGKRQHVVEIFNFVDAGTSILLGSYVHQDYHAETVLETLVQFLREHGVPPIITLDRDPRFVGSSSSDDFPSAFRRFLLCLGITPNICPPQRPDRNSFVERYHRTLNAECLQVHRPGTLSQVREVTQRFLLHYNKERPHQGRSCGNQPPEVAFPRLPVLPALPSLIDPDRWLDSLHGQAFVRRVGRDGCVEVDHESYYLGRERAKQQVSVFVNAPDRLFDVFQGQQRLKRLPIKRLQGGLWPFERYVALMTQEARSEERRAQHTRRPLGQLSLWG